MIADEREATIRLFFPHVRQIARRVGRLARISDLDDLIGDGCVGLIRAFDTFDGKRGTSFEVYARRLIVGGMLNGIRRRDPVSERVRRTMRHADERRFALAQERGSLPAFAELERSDPSLRRARALANERDRALRQAIALLPERERRILALHYGGEQSLHAIGRTLRLSPQRVSQLHLHALARLRHTVARP
jgi:RNA polymerase sigma factor for flagellar operon FliA